MNTEENLNVPFGSFHINPLHLDIEIHHPNNVYQFTKPKKII